MNYQAKGKIFEIGLKESGVSKAGKEWSKIDFVIDTDEQYSKKVCFTLFNDNCELIMDKSVGEMVDVTFNVESKNYNGRWFANVTAYGVASLEQTNSDTEENTSEEPEENEEGDDLPF